ncbi:hypothetical protein ATCC90586_010038 [Pythium insidiosum]|nr:hypothetical protein ATCC90586_010038 [Pythium insidiosum]
MYAKLAVAAVALLSVASAERECDILKDLSVLIPLTRLDALNKCQDASGGFTMVPPTGPPTAEQQAKMCATPACFELIKALNGLNPPDCVIAGLNPKKLGASFEDDCKKLQPKPTSGAPAPAPTSGAPAPAPTTGGPAPAPTSKGPAPAPTTGAPVPTAKPAC